MKNIHLLPADKPSNHVTNYMEQTMQWQNIYITSDEEIKEGDWFIHKTNADLSLHKCVGRPAKQNVIGNNNIDYMLGYCKKVILTDNEDLINDGVQAIDDDFLEWFVKNPSCEEVEVIHGLFNLMGRQVDPMNLGQNHSQCVWKYKQIIPKEPKTNTMKNISKRISEISSLKVNWDGYGGSAPSKNTIELVNSFLIELPQKCIDLIHFEDIVPTSYGTVRIEWENEGYFVSIEIGENGSGYYSELPQGEEPYNDNLESVTNPVPYEFLEALEKLYNS